jgi:uncharacterized protein
MASGVDKMGMTDTGSATLSPWTAIAVGWLLFALLAVLAGKALHADATAALPADREGSWAVAATGWLDRAARDSGADLLVERVGGLRNRTYGSHLRVGTRTPPTTPPADDSLAAGGTAGDDDSAQDDDDSATDVDGAAATVPEGKPAPRRILIVGASSIQFELGHALESALEGYEGVTIHRYGQHSTGLSRPDYFDWVAHGAKLRDEFDPDLVIAQFGGNDCQGMTDLNAKAIGAYGTDGWDAAYYDRVRAFVDLFRENGVPLVMMGMPIMKESGFRKRIAHLNEVVRVAVEHAAQEDGALVQFLSVHDLTADADGNYMEITEVRGRRRIIRATDGAHLTRDGAELVAAQIVEILARSFTLEPSAEVAATGAPAAEGG